MAAGTPAIDIKQQCMCSTTVKWHLSLLYGDASKSSRSWQVGLLPTALCTLVVLQAQQHLLLLVAVLFAALGRMPTSCAPQNTAHNLPNGLAAFVTL
jgi:hypothetical protein